MPVKTKSKRLRSPLLWFGGKGMMVSKLLKLMPPHKKFVEVFGGGASLLFGKEPSKFEVYNDIDERLFNFFKVLQDPELFGRFYHYATLTPYSRKEWKNACETYGEETDPVKKAYLFFVMVRQSFGGNIGHSWGTVVTLIRRNMAGSCSRWLSILAMLPLIHERIMRVQIECNTWQKILAQYNTPEYFAYIDPPYIGDTRRGGGYKYEMTADDHRAFVKAMLEYPGMIMLSGYEHEIYQPLADAGWDITRFEVACYAAGRTRASGLQGKGSCIAKQKRVEVVWRNPACMEAIGAKDNGLFCNN